MALGTSTVWSCWLCVTAVHRTLCNVCTNFILLNVYVALMDAAWTKQRASKYAYGTVNSEWNGEKTVISLYVKTQL